MNWKDVLKNATIAWTVAFCCLAGGVYIAFKSIKLPEPAPLPQPGIPYIVGIPDAGFELGKIAKLKIQLPKELPNGFKSASLIWKLFEVKAENGSYRLVESQDLDVLPDGTLYFSTGLEKRELICQALVTFLSVEDSGASVKNFFLSQRIRIGQGPIPPPGPDPKPDPVNPVLPDGQFKLAQFTFDGVTKNVPANAARRDLAVASASNFRGVAAAIAAGVHKQPEDALKQIKTKNDELTKNDPNKLQWAIFGDSLMNRLYEIDANRLFTDDIQQLRIALIEISDGLEAISKVK